jgi:uncharacterized integral membrane protein
VNDKLERQGSGRGRLVIAIIVLVILVAFVIANTRSVKVSFLFTDRHPPLIFVLVVTAIIGALLDRLWIRIRRKDDKD